MAQILGFNERTIRRDIGSMSEDVRQMSVECPTDVRHMSVTEYGLKWLADKHNVTLPDNVAVDEEVHTDKTASMESELVFSLLEQLRQKDLQLAEKDKQLAEKDIQIGQLIEQSKNYQVLLRGEQERFLLPSKSGFFSRLFHRNS